MKVINIVWQESPPAWKQEAYRLPRSKYMLCCSGRGTPLPPSWDLTWIWGGGFTPSQVWTGVPIWGGGYPTWMGGTRWYPPYPPPTIGTFEGGTPLSDGRLKMVLLCDLPCPCTWTAMVLNWVPPAHLGPDLDGRYPLPHLDLGMGVPQSQPPHPGPGIGVPLSWPGKVYPILTWELSTPHLEGWCIPHTDVNSVDGQMPVKTVPSPFVLRMRAVNIQFCGYF